MIELYKATRNDAATIATLHVRGWQDGYAGLIPQSYLDSLNIEERMARWSKNLADGSNVWISTYKGQPAGVIAFGAPINPVPAECLNCGEISMIYVLAEFYRHGVGGRLFTHALTSLRSENFQSAFLWILEGNTKGRSFYDKMGGTIISGAKQSITLSGESFEEIPYTWDL